MGRGSPHIWAGAIKLGRVTVPVKLRIAASEQGTEFRSLHRACGNTVSQARYCQTCEVDVGWNDTARAVEVEAGRYAIVDDEELELLPGVDVIKLARFVPLTAIAVEHVDRSYYLDTAEDIYSLKAYSALLAALEQTGHGGVGPITIGSHERLALVRPIAGILGLQTLFRQDEVRPVAHAFRRLLAGVQLEPGERKAAVQLVEAKTRPSVKLNDRRVLPTIIDGLATVGAGTKLSPPRHLRRALEASVSKGRR
jgi:DNA end-binding protein Ku